MQSLEQSGSPVGHGYPQMTDGQVAHARLTKHGHRPLGRTQSAPLPLGHPMLTSHNVLSIPQRYEEQRIQHNFLKQVSKKKIIFLLRIFDLKKLIRCFFFHSKYDKPY